MTLKSIADLVFTGWLPTTGTPVRDDAGHASMATTDRYIDSDMRERYESGRQK